MTDALPDVDGDAPAFEAPWQARAFALAVAVTDERGADTPAWDEFQSRLVEEVDAGTAADAADAADAETTYYRQWHAALERLLVDRGVLEAGELLDRVETFEAGDRDAHEFVEGDPHAHADRLPEGHAEGSHHHGDGHDHGDGHGHDHGH